MKKFFLLFSTALFLGSCTDLAVTGDEALKIELPSDFNWEEYTDINKDVKMSQVFFQIREERGEQDTTKRSRENCANLLEDLIFAERIYVDYLGCPRKGWNRHQVCTGKYAYNPNYNEPRNNPTSPGCAIGSCWHSGWEEAADLEIEKCDSDPVYFQEHLKECDDAKGILEGTEGMLPLKSFLTDSLDNYKKRTGSVTTSNPLTRINAIPLMCKFIPFAETADEAKSYLENLISNIDSTLVKEHYYWLGKNEGRPYKYCNNCSKEQCEERNEEVHAIMLVSGNRVFPDFSKYTFCVNKCEDADETKCDYKIYVTD
jgi:hypothetical protein